MLGEDGARKANASSEDFALYAGTDEKTAENVFDIIEFDCVSKIVICHLFYSVNKLKPTHVHYSFHVVDPTATAILPASWHKTLGLFFTHLFSRF